MKIRKFKFKYLWTLILSVAIAAGVVFVCVYAIDNINYSQYQERVQNTNILMEKICNHIETAVDFNWERTRYFTNQFENEKLSTMGEVMDFVSECEKTIKGGQDTSILLISDDGFCHVTDGTSFKWMVPSLLNENSDVMYVSDYSFASKTDMQMHYLSGFSEPITIEGITFTHVSLACDMSELDSFFDVSNYGNESLTFIIHKNGSQVYRQKKETALSGIYNLLSALKSAKFNYGSSYEKLTSDIENSINDCIHITLDGTDYFVSYYRLEIKDWSVVLMVPGEYVGTGTKMLTQRVIQSVLLLFGCLLAAIVVAICITTYQINKKLKQINKHLINAAAAEHAANEAKTNFLSSMSHDIRTPMNAIVGMVTIASKRVDDADYISGCLDKIKLASGHLLTLINDILDISKVESGKMKLSPENFSLAECVNNLVNIMQPQIREKNLDFNIRVHNASQEYFYGDKLRLNQIFINILGNAIKYTNEGGKIRVDIFEDELENFEGVMRIRYVVKDTGVGMSKEFQETMYQSFSRADDHRTGKIQGTGLGLAICKQMVELMDGTIQCESEVGVGTTFTVTIDMPVADTDTEELYLPEMELLLVDDDEVFLEAASDMLQSLGLAVHTAVNGNSALEMVAQRHNCGNDYPFVIIDKKLPDIDGVEAVKIMRDTVGEKTPIIVVSAYDTSRFEEAALEAGASGVLSKPFFRNEVYRRINSFVSDDKIKTNDADEDYEGLSGIRLLVAEDNDLNWEIADTFLQMYGITADRAEDGKHCVDMINKAEEGFYSLVLMDIRMPVMDGREAARIIRGSEKQWHRDIPIIAMTADAFTEDIYECIEAGMDEHIAKPIDMNRLLRMIKKYCNK